MIPSHFLSPPARKRVLGTLALVLLSQAGTAGSQSAGFRFRWSANAVVAGTHVAPVPGGGSATEVNVVEPMLMVQGEGFGRHLVLDGTLDLEGLTIPNGVLGIGDWGEGFNDRRHPHTYAHEIMVSGVNLMGRSDRPLNLSLSAGKGFVPFGSDDPMVRPALRFPVNHHWSQIPERAVAMAGLKAGPLLVEGALFNGDEPERPTQWPRIGGRFGDSWSMRVTVLPLRGIELEGYRAQVHSPENRPGAGTDQTKWQAGARIDRPVGTGRLYALAEWARTEEALEFFKYTSLLGEAQWSTGVHRAYIQLERSDRPEEERTTDPFRSLRPHLENAIMGTTRWSVATAGYGLSVRMLKGRIHLEPMLEATWARVADVGGGLFSSQSLYGRRAFWSLTGGVRLATGEMHRMGRYGVARAGSAGMEHMQ